MTFLRTGEPTILLLDTDELKRQVRAMVFRNCEINLQTAATVEEAIRACTVKEFDLVLLGGDPDRAERVFMVLRKASPRQRIALLVGPPDYLQNLGHKSASEAQSGIIIDDHYFSKNPATAFPTPA